jgi:hypothetical protein
VLCWQGSSLWFLWTDTSFHDLQVGERVTMVCSPDPGAAGSAQPQRTGLLGTAPPFTKPGQPLSMTNHGLGRDFALQPPPSSAAGLPGWVLPAAIIVSASDAASGGNHLQYPPKCLFRASFLCVPIGICRPSIIR